MELDFGDKVDFAPLAARMRPREIADYFGQQHIVGPASRPSRHGLDADTRLIKSAAHRGGYRRNLCPHAHQQQINTGTTAKHRRKILKRKRARRDLPSHLSTGCQQQVTIVEVMADPKATRTEAVYRRLPFKVDFLHAHGSAP